MPLCGGATGPIRPRCRHGEGLGGVGPGRALMISDALLALGLLLSTASELRPAGAPIGPGETLLVVWTVAMLFRQGGRFDSPLTPALCRLLVFWLLFAVALSLGTLAAYALSDIHDPNLFFHDVMAYPLLAAVSCLSVAEPDAGPRLHRVAWLLAVLGSVALAFQVALAWDMIHSAAIDPWIDCGAVNHVPGEGDLKSKRNTSKDGQQPGDAMQPRSGIWLGHAEATDRGQQRISHDVVKEQIWIVNVRKRVRGKRAEAESNSKEQPEYEQAAQRRRQRRIESPPLSKQHRNSPDDQKCLAWSDRSARGSQFGRGRQQQAQSEQCVRYHERPPGPHASQAFAMPAARSDWPGRSAA